MIWSDDGGGKEKVRSSDGRSFQRRDGYGSVGERKMRSDGVEKWRGLLCLLSYYMLVNLKGE